MAFVNVPKDLSKIKNKALFNLTVFGAAAVIGIFLRGNQSEAQPPPC